MVIKDPLFEAAGLTVFERGWLSSNNVLFLGDGEHGPTLVDSGYCTHSAQTVALIGRALGPKPLQRLLNTHLHSDHCGGNHALQQAFDCEVGVPAGEAAKVDAWDEERLTYRVTGQQCPRFTCTALLRAGEEVWCGTRRWQVIASPGHDPESIMLYEPELELLISADALWENGFGVVFPEIEGASAFDDVRVTLDVIGSLPIRWVIPGHGRPFKDASSALARAYRRLDGFVADPARHALHAAKVLIKFHLLEVQQVALSELTVWMENTRYLRLAHEGHFGSIMFATWCESLLAGLTVTGALNIDDGIVRNN